MSFVNYCWLLTFIAGMDYSCRQERWSIFKSFPYEITEGTSVLTDYLVDTANLALTKDVFGLVAVSEKDEGKI